MAIKKRLTRLLVLTISLGLVAAPLAAQRRKDPQPAPKEATRAPQEAATFDNLLAADDYKIYGEIKNIGQLIHSPNLVDVLGPLMKLASPPKEFKALVKFANAHAEMLTTSRMFVAAWPAKPKLPQTLLAIEFGSAEEAQKFEPQLREFLPTILPASTPSPTPGETAAPGKEGAAQSTQPKQAEARPADPKPAPLPFVLKQIGNLVLISDAPFSLKSLRPPNSELLVDNQNFRQAHDRFASEQIFLFVNVALDERKAMAADAELSPLTAKPSAVVIDEPSATTVSEPQTTGETEVAATNASLTPEEQAAAMAEEQPTVSAGDTPSAEQPTLVVGQPSVLQADTRPSLDMDLGLGLIFGNLFGGPQKLPDAVGVAIALETDSYAARVLLVGGPDGKASPVPFISQWVSGPALTLESPSILPSDTELFVVASLDTPQIYEGLVKTMNQQAAASFQRTSRQPRNDSQPVTPFAALEKQLGLKIKEDLLPVLANEFAVSIPVTTFTGTPTTQPKTNAGGEKDQPTAKKESPSPVILISLKDKEAARALVPRIVEGLGFKGAGMLAQKERRDDTEIISYAGAFAYAFVGNFLVLSMDTATTRHVVDSYLAHQTLASDTQFRNSTRWQPRELLGQVYVSPALMESYRTYANNPTALVSDKVREFLTRLSPVSEPVTYSLSSDGLGPLHELHVPKNLILMAIAGISDESNQSPLFRNEQMTRSALMMIANSETTYQRSQGKGQYGSLEQLADSHLVSKDMLRDYGYRVELIVSGNKFTATAVPLEYNKTGKLSYFVDETGVIRAADHGGAPATVSDEVIQ